MNSEIIIRANGSTQGGLGHLYRGLAISECIPSGITFTFVTNYRETHKLSSKKINVYLTQDDENDFKIFEKFKNLKVIIIDGYQFDSQYQKKLKGEGYRSIYIDDLASEYMYSDIVINHSPGFVADDYRGEAHVKYFLGPKYSIVRKEFVNNRYQNEKRKGILIVMGGSDQFDITRKILEYLNKHNNSDIPIHVVLGNNYEGVNKLYSFNNLNLEIYKNLDSTQLSQLMLNSMYGVMPASTVLYEYLMCGGNAISGFYVDNQKKVYDYFLQEKLIHGLGNLKENFQESLIQGINKPIDRINAARNKGFDQNSHLRLKTIISNLLFSNND